MAYTDIRKRPMAAHVKQSLAHASRALGVHDPLPIMGPMIERTFYRSDDDIAYADNRLTPGAVPFEPSFSEAEPDALRFTIEPLGPGASPVDRRDDATREMRRLIAPLFGRDALNWFDTRSEEWRGMSGLGWMSYGAWFGSAFDEDGLYAAKIYYELAPGQIDALAPNLARLTRMVMAEMPGLMPIFTSIGCKRDAGSQRVTFMHRGPLALAALGPLMNRLGIGHQLPSLMRVVGVALGGRFELPNGGVLIGLRHTPEGVEMKLEVLLAALPDLPGRFLDLLRLGLAERPRQVAALERWLSAFGVDDADEQGHFSVLSVNVTPSSQARISLYVRPIEFQMRDTLDELRVLESEETNMPASVFPSSAVRRPAPPPVSKPAASRETVEAARLAVRGLLQRSQAFSALPEERRRQLAHDLVQIGSYLAEPDGERLKRQSPQVRALAGDSSMPQPQEFGQATRAGVADLVGLVAGVNFPGFVSGLIQGVFHSIVDSSIQQMEAYAKLVADVSKSLNQFRDDNTTDNQGRDHLIEQFPDIFELSMAGGDVFGDFGADSNTPPQPTVTVRDNVDEKSAVDRLNRSLPLDKPLTGLDNDLVEALLVPAARTQLATGRQQLLATMVMMGINRIVVTDGKIAAKVVFDFHATDNRKYAYSATKFDHEKDQYGNLQMTSTYSGDYEGKSEGGSYSKTADSEDRRDGSYYAKGSYKYSQQPVVKLMSTQRLMDDSQLQTKAQLTGAVEVNFKSDYLPLEKMANPENIAAIQMNAQPGMVKSLAARPQAAAPVAAPAPPAVATPTPPAAAR